MGEEIEGGIECVCVYISCSLFHFSLFLIQLLQIQILYPS